MHSENVNKEGVESGNQNIVHNHFRPRPAGFGVFGQPQPFRGGFGNTQRLAGFGNTQDINSEDEPVS